jgi:hypothetical protein
MHSPNTSIAGDAAGRGLLSTYYGSKIWTAPAVAAVAKILNIVKLPELEQAGVSGWPTLPRCNVRLG